VSCKGGHRLTWHLESLILPGIILGLTAPNDLCYARSIGRSAASGLGATLHRPKAFREFESDNIPKPQNGQGARRSWPV
jgi:hypothetical protein